MNERPTHSSAPIDAEYEPADTQGELGNGPEKPPRSRGPGWIAFTFLLLIALGGLGLSLWSSGLLRQTQLPTPSDTAMGGLQNQQAAMEQRIGELSAQVEGLIDRIDAEVSQLETEVAEMREAPQPAPTTDELPEGFEARLAGLEDQVAAITEAQENAVDPARINAIESALETARTSESGASTEQLVSLRTELESLRADLASLQEAQAGYSDELGSIREDATELSESSARIVSASLALAAIEATAARGEPFQTEFQQLREARPDDPDVTALSSLSQIGIPTLSTLKTSFRTLRDTTLSRNTEDSSGLGWVNTVFGESVSVRRTAPGSETADRLADAEAALARDDLGIAIEAVEALPESTKPVFQTWLADARRRARLEDSLEDLRLKLIAAGQ